MNQQKVEGMCLPCKSVETRNWFAWNDLMPPQPDFFFIAGEVCVPNPAVQPLLAPSVPPGINPAVLLLDLYLLQSPGIWTEDFIWNSVRYERKIIRGYTHVEIRSGGDTIATVEVQDIH